MQEGSAEVPCICRSGLRYTAHKCGDMGFSIQQFGLATPDSSQSLGHIFCRRSKHRVICIPHLFLFPSSHQCITRSLVLGLQYALDSAYYGKPTFTPLNFFLTNLTSVSTFYGGNQWHFYLSAALPMLCGTCLPFVLLGARAAFKGSKRDSGPLQLASYTVGWTIVIYSLSRHKEWRFIHPVLPLLQILAAKWLVDNSDQPSRAPGKIKPKGAIQSWIRSPPLRKPHISILLIQAPISVFLVLDYCSAPISVMSYLRGLPTEDLSRSIGFLMPCHSTPGYAYLHRSELSAGKWWMLGCEPPLRLALCLFFVK